MLYGKVNNIPLNLYDWKLICPRNLPMQKDGHSCGVFACTHGYNLMSKNDTKIPNHGNMLQLRYWITYITCICHATRRYKCNEKLEIVALTAIPKKELIVLDSVPGHGKLNPFFLSLREYLSEHDRQRLDNPSSRKSSCSSEDSLYRQEQEIKWTTEQLSPLKEELLQRLHMDIGRGNERYQFLAAYGKEKFMATFYLELEVIYSRMTEDGIDHTKGALYKIFANERNEQDYFSICLPTIICNRYGFTSAQFIDYVILPDALCLNYMRENDATYAEAVSRTCGEENSRMTVYWEEVMSRVGDAKKETAHVIAVIGDGGQEDTEEEWHSPKAEEGSTSSKDVSIVQKPEKISCNTYIRGYHNGDSTIKAIVNIANKERAPTLAVGFLHRNRRSITRSVKMFKQLIKDNADCCLKVIRFLLLNTEECMGLLDD
eukprot:gene15510-17091_t